MNPANVLIGVFLSEHFGTITKQPAGCSHFLPTRYAWHRPLANEYSGFQLMCFYVRTCQQAAQAAALATDRLAKRGSPLFQYMATKIPLCSAVLFALELCPGVRSRESALAQTAGL
jgi:hypothetical protein